MRVCPCNDADFESVTIRLTFDPRVVGQELSLSNSWFSCGQRVLSHLRRFHEQALAAVI